MASTDGTINIGFIDTTRPVTVYEWTIDNTKTKKCGGRFHEFGVDCLELRDGGGNFSTAIVELDDGTVLNVSVDLIKFNDRGGE